MDIKDLLLQIVEVEVAKKSTCCGRCGHMHKKGTPCPKPFYSKDDPRHCKNRKK